MRLVISIQRVRVQISLLETIAYCFFNCSGFLVIFCMVLNSFHIFIFKSLWFWSPFIFCTQVRVRADSIDGTSLTFITFIYVRVMPYSYYISFFLGSFIPSAFSFIPCVFWIVDRDRAWGYAFYHIWNRILSRLSI